MDESLHLFNEPYAIEDKEKERRSLILQKVQGLSLKLIYDSSIQEDNLREAGILINRDHYDGVTEERSINKLCGYPLCLKRLKTLTIQEQRQKFSICRKQNALYKIDRRRNFCSGICFAASEFFRKQLSDSSIFSLNAARYPEIWKDKNTPRRLQLGDEIISKRKLFQQCINCHEANEENEELLDHYLMQLKSKSPDNFNDNSVASKTIHENIVPCKEELQTINETVTAHNADPISGFVFDFPAETNRVRDQLSSEQNVNNTEIEDALTFDEHTGCIEIEKPKIERYSTCETDSNVNAKLATSTISHDIDVIPDLSSCQKQFSHSNTSLTLLSHDDMPLDFNSDPLNAIDTSTGEIGCLSELTTDDHLFESPDCNTSKLSIVSNRPHFLNRDNFDIAELVIVEWISDDSRNMVVNFQRMFHHDLNDNDYQTDRIKRFLGISRKLNRSFASAISISQWRVDFVITNIIKSVNALKINVEQFMNDIETVLRAFVKTLNLTNVNIILKPIQLWDIITSMLITIFLHYHLISNDKGKYWHQYTTERNLNTMFTDTLCTKASELITGELQQDTMDTVLSILKEVDLKLDDSNNSSIKIKCEFDKKYNQLMSEYDEMTALHRKLHSECLEAKSSLASTVEELRISRTECDSINQKYFTLSSEMETMKHSNSLLKQEKVDLFSTMENRTSEINFLKCKFLIVQLVKFRFSFMQRTL
ncbi:hypothetical protein GJ496_011695 [Pomphorhynchus laevis]|nr:hypothetical protein GJ496_011695 [Pomphorhynchus laevis]